MNRQEYRRIFIAFIMIVIGLSLIIASTGCQTKIDEKVNEVRETREDFVEYANRLKGKYIGLRESYRSLRGMYTKYLSEGGALRQDIRDNCNDGTFSTEVCNKLGKLEDKIVELDYRLSEFDAKAEELYRRSKRLNAEMKELEQIAKEADKHWTKIVEIITNVSEIGVQIAEIK